MCGIYCGITRRYWHQRADERLGDPPQKVYPAAFASYKQGWKTARGPPVVHCFCVCSGSALLGDLLGVSRSMERDFLSLQSIYCRIFLNVFICVGSY